MASLTAHQVAAWLRAHTLVQEEHINALLQQEVDGDVLDLLDKADLQRMTGDGLSAARIVSAWAKHGSADTNTIVPSTATCGANANAEPKKATIMHTTVHDEAAQLQPGTRVLVISVERGWANVELAGNRGWVAETDVLLDPLTTAPAHAEASDNALTDEQLFDATAPPVYYKHGESKYGEKHLLSNLARTPFTDGSGTKYDTLEAWFQSRKTNAGRERENFHRGGCYSLGFAAKQAGRRIKMATSQLREWDSGAAEAAMLQGMRFKFTQHLPSRQVLLSTHPSRLEHDLDGKWGRLDGTHAKLLMVLRREYRE
jgi:predicted NAD-dependent protein-ADP-ribosyltransferase YbiA (DUF1768 family)